jgi:AAA15 family ATPase/GTPase
VVSHCAFIDNSGSNRTGMVRISSGCSWRVAAYPCHQGRQLEGFMARIKIRNFGPITDGFIDIKKITFFCGHQGSGKSTVAKLVSAFSWIEKALLRGDFQESDVTEEVLKNERFEYLDIGNFFIMIRRLFFREIFILSPIKKINFHCQVTRVMIISSLRLL